MFINGISQGISDWNPISSAFVVSVLLMSAIGLRDPIVAMMAASVLLVSTIVGVDMQQDRRRAGGWDRSARSSSAIRRPGIAMGSVLCVVLAEFFMSTNPVLRIDTFAHPEAIAGRMAVGDDVQVRRRDPRHRRTSSPFTSRRSASACHRLLHRGGARAARRLARLPAPIDRDRAGFAIGWIVDAILLGSPYASSTGGFLEPRGHPWFAVGSVASSLLGWDAAARKRQGGGRRPARRHEHDLAVGGGLIAGESLYALGAA